MQDEAIRSNERQRTKGKDGKSASESSEDSGLHHSRTTELSRFHHEMVSIVGGEHCAL